MDVFSEIVMPVVQVLMNPVKKQVGYMIDCTKYVREMHNKMKEMEIARLGEEDHLNMNTRSRLEISSQVRGWLEEAEKTKEKVQNLPTEVGSYCNLKARHKLGKQAFKTIEEINSIMSQHSLIMWTDDPIPLGKIDSMVASTFIASSSSSDPEEDFFSRQMIFTEALKALGPNKKSHMVALCGMGGVGKTTMMQRLKKIVQQKRMLGNYVEAIIGEKTDPIAIQDAVADYLSIKLEEKTKPERAKKLHDWFVRNSDEGKTKFLVILDDVWEAVDLNDIGLSPFPNLGVDFKVLLTSRKRHVCVEMGVEDSSILKVNLLTKAEAQNLFWRKMTSIERCDPELHKIGEDIVSKCSGLPIAVKTIALALRDKSEDAWKDALLGLERHDTNQRVKKVFEISYNNLRSDEITKSIFLLCGLFPEDYDIPTEELFMYGWGLNLFKGKLKNIREARYKVKSCIECLIDSNLLIESYYRGRVKMHDLVRDFVVNLSTVEHASIVNHNNISKWPDHGDDDDVISSSCTKISLTCEVMYEFPRALKYRDLLILKLRHGYKLPRFPKDFHGEMK